MAWRKKRTPLPTTTTRQEEANPPENIGVPSNSQNQEEPNRLITPQSGITQILAPMRLIHWMPSMGSAPTVTPPNRDERFTPIEAKGSAPTILLEGHEESKQQRVVIPMELAPQTANPARKLTYTSQSKDSPTMVELVRGNRITQSGQQLEYYPPVINDGLKMVKLNPTGIVEESRNGVQP